MSRFAFEAQSSAMHAFARVLSMFDVIGWFANGW